MAPDVRKSSAFPWSTCLKPWRPSRFNTFAKRKEKRAFPLIRAASRKRCSEFRLQAAFAAPRRCKRDARAPVGFRETFPDFKDQGLPFDSRRLAKIRGQISIAWRQHDEFGGAIGSLGSGTANTVCKPEILLRENFVSFVDKPGCNHEVARSNTKPFFASFRVIRGQIIPGLFALIGENSRANHTPVRRCATMQAGRSRSSPVIQAAKSELQQSPPEGGTSNEDHNPKSKIENPESTTSSQARQPAGTPRTRLLRGPSGGCLFPFGRSRRQRFRRAK